MVSCRALAVVVALLLTVVIVAPDPALASHRAGGSFQMTNNTGQNVNDFHVNIFQDEDCIIDFNSIRQGGQPLAPTGAGPAAGRNGVSGNWAGGNVAPGGVVEFRMDFKSTCNEYDGEFFWTQNGQQVGPVGPLGPRFRAGGLFNLLRFVLNNPYPTPLEIAGLQFKLSPTEVPFDDFRPFVLTGFDAPRPTFILQPGQEMEFAPGSLGAEQFLYAQMIATPLLDTRGVGANNSIPVLFEHETELPEPTGALAAAGAVLAFANSRRASRRR